MSEMLVLNPRRRRRKSHAKRTGTRRRRATTGRRRRRTTVHAHRAHNPRRRRSVARRRVHRRRRRNPSLGGHGMTGTLTKGLWLAGGVAVTNAIGNKLASMLPANLQSNPDVARIGTKAALGIGLPILLRKVRLVPPGIANALAVGGAIAFGLDVVKTYIAPKVPFLSDYEQVPLMGTDSPEVLQSYEAMQLTGTDSAYGGGAY